MKYLKMVNIVILSYLLIFFMVKETSSILANQVKLEVAAHYVDWFSLPWDLPIYTTPLRGLYNSNDPIIAAEQNQEKNEYGISIDVISWAGPRDHLENNLLAGYFNAYNFGTRKFYILYEIVPLLGEKENACYDFNDPVMEQKFLYHIDYIVETFAQYPNYYKIDGRPVVLIWAGIFKNFEGASAQARKKVYLVGPEPILSPPSDSNEERINRVRYWDAITCYGIEPTVLAGEYGALNPMALKRYVTAVTKWDRILRLYSPKTDLFIPLSFAYHDFRGDVDDYGKSRILTSTPEQAEMMAKTVKFLAEKLGRKNIFLVSYNEHFEGTGAEPSIEYGDLWLRLIKKYFSQSEPFFEGETRYKR